MVKQTTKIKKLSDISNLKIDDRVMEKMARKIRFLEELERKGFTLSSEILIEYNIPEDFGIWTNVVAEYRKGEISISLRARHNKIAFIKRNNQSGVWGFKFERLPEILKEYRVN